MAGGNRGGVGAHQQHRQPLADPPSPDSTDPKVLAFSNVTFTSSSTVRTLDCRTSWAPRRNSIKASAPHFKEPPLPSTPFFWEWVALLSTTITCWSLLRCWVLILKKLRNLLPSIVFILWIMLPSLSIPDVLFPALISALIRRRFQVKPATFLIPIIFSFFLWWRGFMVPVTKVAPFP